MYINKGTMTQCAIHLNYNEFVVGKTHVGITAKPNMQKRLLVIHTYAVFIHLFLPGAI